MPSKAASSDVIVARYAGTEMARLFSKEHRIVLWRSLWIALAEAEQELGLPIKKSQIAVMKRYATKINWAVAEKKEHEIRHDVMAHVHAYGSQARKAAGIIHLGATSTYVTDNADLILLREGMNLVARKLANVIDRLATFALKEKDTATVAYTHLQAAQPTTVGKRAAMWLQNFALDIDRLEQEAKNLRFLGVKGATGTQDSFLKLFNGDVRKVRELDRKVTRKMGFSRSYQVTGQTYPRKVDTQILSTLAGIAESAAKLGNDLRLLQAFHEVEEPREGSQVGSSAMPYKRNPMRSERICSLARYLTNLVSNCYDTASTQWLERTLDDSANRRLVLPHAFLVCDGILNLTINVVGGLSVQHAVIEQRLELELPFLQTEEILMDAVRLGGDRQELHEKIRKHAHEVMQSVRVQGNPNDLLTRIRNDPGFAKVSPTGMVRAEPSRLIGMASLQVERFIQEEIAPIRRKYRKFLNLKEEVRV